MSWQGQVVIPGPAVTQGSKRIGRAGKSGKAILLDTNHTQLRSWRYAAQCAMQEAAPQEPLDVALGLWVTVYVPRPQSHYRTNGELKLTAPKVPATGKDLDKVARAVGDAGTGIWWRDDRRISSVTVTRKYADDGKERVVISAWEVAQQ